MSIWNDSHHFRGSTTTCSRPFFSKFRKSNFIFFFLRFKNPQIPNVRFLRFFFHRVDFRSAILEKEFFKNFGLTWKAIPKSLYQTARIIFVALFVSKKLSIKNSRFSTCSGCIRRTKRKIGKLYLEKLFSFPISITQFFFVGELLFHPVYYKRGCLCVYRV